MDWKTAIELFHYLHEWLGIECRIIPWTNGRAFGLGMQFVGDDMQIYPSVEQALEAVQGLHQVNADHAVIAVAGRSNQLVMVKK